MDKLPYQQLQEFLEWIDEYWEQREDGWYSRDNKYDEALSEKDLAIIYDDDERRKEIG